MDATAEELADFGDGRVVAQPGDLTVENDVDALVDRGLDEFGGLDHLVTITSRSVKEAIPSLVLSNSVRMAIIGLEKTLSTEHAPEVRANAILPGPHETRRIRQLVEQSVERGEYESY